jgi:NAD-dependent DNA ligase
MDREELQGIRRYTFRSELDKALHTLEGILKGISLDGKVTPGEVSELRDWTGAHYQYLERHPFKEIIPLIRNSLSDNRLDPEEVQDILWMANNLHTNNKYYDAVTADIQRLEGLLHGMIADNVIEDKEVEELGRWLFDNEQLKGSYPFDELCSLVTAITADGKIDEMERRTIKRFISEFVDVRNMESLDQKEIAELRSTITLPGICALDPILSFPDRVFCLTGIFGRSTKKEIEATIIDKGGRNKPNVTLDTDYLIVGASGNPCWAFSCYGRKVEKAAQLRRDGSQIAIINEVDFWDALQ